MKAHVVTHKARVVSLIPGIEKPRRQVQQYCCISLHTTSVGRSISTVSPALMSLVATSPLPLSATARTSTPLKVAEAIARYGFMVRPGMPLRCPTFTSWSLIRQLPTSRKLTTGHSLGKPVFCLALARSCISGSVDDLAPQDQWIAWQTVRSSDVTSLCVSSHQPSVRFLCQKDARYRI